jgi:hypothetical protein
MSSKSSYTDQQGFFFQGRLAEFGPPALLLDSNGIFSSMARSAGITVPHQ